MNDTTKLSNKTKFRLLIREILDDKYLVFVITMITLAGFLSSTLFYISAVMWIIDIDMAWSAWKTENNLYYRSIRLIQGGKRIT